MEYSTKLGVSNGRHFPDLCLVVVIFTWLCTTVQAVPPLIHDYACFNKIFEIACEPSEKIVFESGRFGRNDTEIAAHCLVPYQRNCDVDVHVTLNRACGGKSRCSMAVNTGLFIDPCGYDEFLRVTYRCAPETSRCDRREHQTLILVIIKVALGLFDKGELLTCNSRLIVRFAAGLGISRKDPLVRLAGKLPRASTVHQTCQAPGAPVLYDHGYIASPNYPGRYYMDARCTWTISVQKRQTIRITLLDFELVAKRGGRCHDRVYISTHERVYFDDCGVLGKEILAVDDHTATILFETGISSLTDRGFFLYFEAVGPGCPDLEELDQGYINYFIENDILYANATCDYAYYFEGTELSKMQAKCLGSSWNMVLPECMAMPPLTSPRVIVMDSTPIPAGNSGVDHSVSLIGIALGVVSAILLISLLLVLALYFHRRRRHRHAKPDPWQLVVNNLQSEEANKENLKLHEEMASTYGYIAGKASPAHSNIRKGYPIKNTSMYEDEWQGRNLLKTGCEEEDTGSEWLDSDYNTSLKCVDEGMSPTQCPTCPRKGSISQPVIAKHSLTRSNDNNLDNHVTSYDHPPYLPQPTVFTVGGRPLPPPRPPKRDLHTKRTKSGQWDAPAKNSAIYTPAPNLKQTSERGHMSHSAPDLITMLPPLPPQDCCVHTGYPIGTCCQTPTARGQNITRSSTMGVAPGHRSARSVGRTGSKGKVRC